MRKRLIASTNTDALLTLFKAMVNVEQIAGKLYEQFNIWLKAKFGNKADENNTIDNFSEWFDGEKASQMQDEDSMIEDDGYYMSVVDDCLNNAKRNQEFYEKYQCLQTVELEDFDTQLKSYIKMLKPTILDVINNNAMQDMYLDNLQSADIYISDDDNSSEEEFDFSFDDDNSDDNGDENTEDDEFDFDFDFDEEK